MKIDWESLLGIVYSNNIYICLIAFIIFSLFCLVYLNLVHKHCIINKHATEETAISTLFGIIYTAMFILLVPLTSIIIVIFLSVKMLTNEKRG